MSISTLRTTTWNSKLSWPKSRDWGDPKMSYNTFSPRRRLMCLRPATYNPCQQAGVHDSPWQLLRCDCQIRVRCRHQFHTTFSHVARASSCSCFQRCYPSGRCRFEGMQLQQPDPTTHKRTSNRYPHIQGTLQP